MTKITCLNVNGIRAAEKKGFVDWLMESQPDVLCLQELKALPEQVPASIQELDYHGFYHSAEKKGYSGVGILSKAEPHEVKVGMGIDWVDKEGRVLMAEFDMYRVFSIYAPSGTSGDIRQDVKYKFLDAFFEFITPYLDDPKPTLFCGDFNIAHTEIDIHNPKANKNTSGFLQEERDWVTKVLASGFEDTFREVNKDVVDLYSWWSYRANARANNKGWRIDYHLGTKGTAAKASNGVVEKDYKLSDHAAVSVEYDF